MSWKNYENTVRHDFDEFSCPEFWVELVRLDSMPYGDAKDYINQAQEIANIEDEEDQTVASFKTGEDGLNVNDRTLIRCISEWYFTDPDTGEDLPVPTFEDPGSLDRLPTEFITRMHQWMWADSNMTQGREPATFPGEDAN